MRVLSRLSLLFWLTAACCVMIYAARLIGRAIPAAIVAGRERESALDPMDVLLIDFSRGLSIERRLAMPHAIRADWEARPPQVLMRLAGADEVTFWINQIDFTRIRLEPLVTHRVPADPRPRDLTVALSGQRAAVYSPATGEVTRIDGGTSANQRVSVTENSNEMIMTWSPDGNLLAVKDYRSAQLALLDGQSVRLIDTLRDAAPVWLSDSRSILLAQDTFLGRNGRIRLIDAISGEAQPYTIDLTGRSAAMCGMGTLGYVYALPDSRYAVRTLDLATGEVTTVLEAGRTEGGDIVMLSFAPREACDWMLLEIRRPNNVGTRLYRLHIPSGHLTLLGDNTRVLELTADGVIYESTTARVALTVGQAAFDIGAEPQIFGRIPAQYQMILWLDGYRRGIFLRDGQLWSIDLATGTRPLTEVRTPLRDIQLVTQQ